MGKKHDKKFSLEDRLKSFSFAFNGLRNLWKEEHNFRFHFFATILVIIAGFVFKISIVEWIAIMLSVGLVLSTEIMNTSIENLSDFVSPGNNEQIKKIKDISAAGVLIASTIAVLVGLLVFLPRIFALL